MSSYWLSDWGPKVRTFTAARKRIANWPTAFSMRCRPGWRGLRLLQFRNGLSLICRGGTQDWDVVRELAILEGYACAHEFLNGCKSNPIILDMGANIGVFSMLAAHRCPTAQIHAFEPAPANIRMIELHRLANDSLAPRIQLHPDAVGGRARRADFFYDAGNPQASRIEEAHPQSFPVQIRAFSEIIGGLPKPVSLVKMDIECSEYEVVELTERATWDRVEALSVELHPNERGKLTENDFLARMKEHGFTNIVQEKIGGACFFLSR